MYEEYLQILYAFLKAFAVGGAICAIAQIIVNFTDWTSGKILVYFMLAGVVLQGLGLYQYLVDFAGAKRAFRRVYRRAFGCGGGNLGGGDLLIYHGIDFPIEE